MTKQEYTAALDKHATAAAKWADKQLGIIPSHRKLHKTHWDRHYSFYMDEVRRKMGKRMSYDEKPSMFRIPHLDSGTHSLYEVAKKINAACTGIEFTAQGFMDISVAKARFGTNRWQEAKEAAEAYLKTFDVKGYMAVLRESVSADMAATT